MKMIQLKITLVHSNPEVYRRIIVPSNISFKQLHKIIQIAFGWDDSHSYEFIYDDLGIKFRKSTNYDDQCLYKIMKRRTIIDEYMKEGQSCHYIYNPQEYWDHMIIVEGLFLSDHDCVTLLGHSGDNFIEDCGGMKKYYKIQEIINNPSHKLYNEYVDWFIQEEYDSEFVRKKLENLF